MTGDAELTQIAQSHLDPAQRGEPSRAMRFELATAAHDAPLRRLLRDNPMRGSISVSLEREPNYFAADKIDGSRHRTIIATEGERVICCGSISIRKRYVNGVPTNVGYLSGLRLDHSWRGRSLIIRRGYQFFRELHEREGVELYLTSIVADNQPARRLLERGITGMPTYRFLGEWVTLILPTRRRGIPPRRHSTTAASASDLPEILHQIERRQREYQFAPVWTTEDFSPHANEAKVHPEDFQLLMSAGHVNDRARFRASLPLPVLRGTAGEGALVYIPNHPRSDNQREASQNSLDGCAALWDQRAVKQTVVRGYSKWLHRARPMLNIANLLLRRPRLPAPGQPLSHAYVSHLATDPANPAAACVLIDALCAVAFGRGIDYLTVGFDARDPRLAELRKRGRHREYVSRLYCVYWKDGQKLADSLDARLFAPEVALL